MKTKEELAAAFRRDLAIGFLFIIVVGIASLGLARAYDTAQADKDRAVLLGAESELATLRHALATPPTSPADAIALDDAVNAAETRVAVLIASHGTGPRTFDVVEALSTLGATTENVRIVCTLAVDKCSAANLASLKADTAKALAAMAGPTRWAAAQAKPASAHR